MSDKRKQEYLISVGRYLGKEAEVAEQFDPETGLFYPVSISVGPYTFIIEADDIPGPTYWPEGFTLSCRGFNPKHCVNAIHGRRFLAKFLDDSDYRQSMKI